MSKRPAIASLLFTLLISGWIGNAHAALIRYDVTITHPLLSPALSGYMVFNDTGPVPGNIFPNVVDWYFNAGGFVFDTSNTQAHPVGSFVVDANYNFVSDFSGPIPNLSPCFGANACQSFPTTYIAFTKSLGIVILDSPSYDFDNTGATVEYSDPIFLNEVPLPSILGLFAIALAGLASSRRAIIR